MATDARAHTVPAATDHPTRQALLTALLSVRDPIPVASTSARASLLVTLAALSPAITPSTSNPIIVFRADAAAGLEHEYTTDGSNWYSLAGVIAGGLWTAYTPTYSGMTIGNGTTTARYSKTGRTITATGLLTMGTTTTFSGTIVMTIPVAVNAVLWSSSVSVGTAALTDVSATVTEAALVLPNTTTQVALRRTANGAPVNNTVPWTWATGDTIGWTYTYESAS